ncbi:hypothetical protein HDU79_010012, partial [Rhizoclosmatium sp. JEL0117]
MGVDEEVDTAETEEPATTATVSGGKSGKSTKAAKSQKKKDKKAKQSGGGKDVTLRKWAMEKFGFLYGPALVDHALSFGSVLDAAIKTSEVVGDDSTFERIVDALVNGFGDANRIMDLAFEGKHAFEGWITQVEHKLPADPPILHHNTISKCVDEFLTHTESHRLQLRLPATKTTGSKKLSSVSQSHTAQVTRLQTAMQQSAKVAACIESNLEVVDAVINTVRQFVASGMDWVELWELVKEEARMGNYVASVITGLKLEVGVVSVGLLDPEFVDEEGDGGEDEDSEEESDSDDDADVKAARGRKRAEKAKLEKEREKRRRENTLKIDLDIYLSAWGNARRYYDSKKLAAVKAEKTIHAVGKALKQAEKKITQDLKATKSAAPMIKTIRTPYWFEKYYSLHGGGKDVTLRKWAKEKFGFLYGGPALVDHALSFGSVLDVAIKTSEVVGDDSPFERIVHALVNGFRDANRIMDLAFEGKHAFEGWITQVEHKGATLPNSESTQDTLIIYDEFHPYNFSQLAHLPADPPILHHNTFSKCVDEFFTHTESHRLQLRLHAAETTASKKLASVSQSHTAQVTRLQTATQQSAKVAACIESNLEVVDAVINTVRQFVASGMDWVELWELVKEEARMENYIASVLTGLKLEVGVVSVGLLDPEFVDEEGDGGEDEDSEEESDSDDDADVKAARGRKRAEKAKLEKEREKRRRENTLKIDLDIYLSAWGNARRYYDSKKLAAVKAEKTIHAVGKALKQAEKKITQDLKATKSATPMIKTI